MKPERTVELGVRVNWKARAPRIHSGLWAFTLIELLAVIAIIGLLSGLVIGLSGIAVQKQREARIRGDHTKLLTALDSYKSEMGNYPPDNGELSTWPVDSTTNANYLARAGKNPLYYELSGALFNNGTFTVMGSTQTITATVLNREFKVNGIENSAREKRDVRFRNMTFKGDQYQQLDTVDKAPALVLSVPIKGEFQLPGKNGPINPWYYDASSTNRHNPETFDLWSEYLAGNQKIPDGSGGYKTVPRKKVFGNWKE
jgi:prepilin-type N-terminal cleavage/methylation domain-containing protein